MSWFEHFFEGLATDVWRQSVSPEQTQAEAAFLIRHLQLEKSNHVLDIPCADGRLAIPLAKKGIHVTGVDLSKRCLQAARADAGSWPITYELMDMRKLQYHEQFDAAFCMGNSFGYFNRADTQSFLSGVAEALRTGGHFILDTCLAAETLFTVGGSKEWVDVNGVIMLMENEYRCDLGRLDSRFIFMSGGTSEEHDTQHWIFTTAEICRMLEEAGLKVEHLWSSLDGEPFTLGSDRLLITTTKQGLSP